MKKILTFLVCLAIGMGVAFADSTVYEKPDVKIIVEGTELQLGAEVPIIVNSRTLIPLRKLLVGLGVPDNTENIQWIGDTREVKVIYNGVTIDLAIDDTKGYINGKEYTLDSAPIIHRDRTYLPARFVGEALGYTITWDQYTPAVIVNSNQNMEKINGILNDLKTAMNNVRTYEVESTLKVDVDSNDGNGNSEEYSYNITNKEKADLEKKIVYYEESSQDNGEIGTNYSYCTPDAFYNCYEYTENGELVNDGWEIFYAEDDIGPFDDKGKLGLIDVAENLNGAFVCEEQENYYLIHSVSNQIDVAQMINDKALYEEVVNYTKVDDFKFEILIDKTTKMPASLTVKYTGYIGNDEEGSYELLGTSSGEYNLKFISYNENMDFVLPEVDESNSDISIEDEEF